MSKQNYAVWIVLMTLFVAGSCQEAAKQPEKPAATAEKAGAKVGKTTLFVHAAASTSEALKEVLAQYPAAGDIELVSNFGSSAALAEQIISGAQADIFLSASQEWADKLAAEGLVAEQHPLLGNQLVVIVPSDAKETPQKLADLAAEGLGKLALADPDSVPAGKYAKQALEKVGVWEAISTHVVRGADVRQALTYVDRGEVGAGIVYATDAASSPEVRVAFVIEPEFTSPIVYPLALLKPASEAGQEEKGKDQPESEPSSAARALYEYLCSPQAATVFEKHGFKLMKTK